jgi:hypothetical protein
MNARGAMGLVVATVGLSLGILTQGMYSMLVMIAVVTSLMAPVLLRLTMRRVRMTEEETQRMAEEASRGLFDAQRLRVLVPTGVESRAIHHRLFFGYDNERLIEACPISVALVVAKVSAR